MGGNILKEPESNLMELVEVSRCYPLGGSQVQALNKVSLSIARGEFIGIMGPSASGKSTLLNILGCLDTPTSGQYLLEGREVSSLSRIEKARIRNGTFGFVFQAFNLLPEMSVAANVALPLRYGGSPRSSWKDRVKEALKAVGLDGEGERFPDQLSGGQQQRVAIARALVNNPDVILADEPTGNLDTAIGQEIMAVLRKLREQSGRTIVVISHNSRMAAYADRLIQLEDGRITADVRMDKAAQGESIVKNPFSIPDGEVEDESFL